MSNSRKMTILSGFSKGFRKMFLMKVNSNLNIEPRKN